MERMKKRKIRDGEEEEEEEEEEDDDDVEKWEEFNRQVIPDYDARLARGESRAYILFEYYRTFMDPVPN